MSVEAVLARLNDLEPSIDNRMVDVSINEHITLQTYPNSILATDSSTYFIAKKDQGKFLWVLTSSECEGDARELVSDLVLDFEDGALRRCPLNHHNAQLIRSRFSFARPVVIGLDDSFGYGDRLGIANPAHIRVGRQSRLKPILAQQSIRELQRTQRTPEEVMDAATWAVLQEGYKDGFGADADHLKSTADIDLMVKAGFTMFTIDPGDHVVNEADTLSLQEVERRILELAQKALGENAKDFVGRYADNTFPIADDFVLNPSLEETQRGMLKYGSVISIATKLYSYLKKTYPDHSSEVELSVDETDAVTSPFEHFLVANELKRRGVELVSMAPRFVGDFEKGIDYRGDIDQFAAEYKKHLKIAEKLGPYKISFHSGSDKFRVYEAVGKLQGGAVHVKTAGTSYLEGLRTVAATLPAFFREILDFARGLYEQEKKTYHVSAMLEKVLPSEQYTDEQLTLLFAQDDARQVLHVTFGRVLTETDAQGQSRFRDRIMACLTENEETHYDFLYRHFERHLTPFEKA